MKGGRERSLGRHRQRGFSIVTAIFLLVVLGGLAAYMVTIGGVQYTTVAYGVQGARAYQAAQSGVEWGVHQARNNTVPTCGAAPSSPTTNTFALTGGGLNGFNVAVTCEYTVHQERSDFYNIYVLTVTASQGSFGARDFFSRTIRASVTDAP